MNIMRIQGEAERCQGVYYEYDRDSAPLGEGGMGRIFQGFRVDELSGGFRTPVAIKEIHDSIARDPQLIERAMRESSVQINHDNLLRMFGFIPNVEYDPMHDTNIMRYYMVMERLVGVNLDQIINGVVCDKSGMVIPYAQEICELYKTNRIEAIVRIMKGVLSGIMALHENGFIHRDIDPSNIMITIVVQDKALTQAGSFIGKTNYAAPELALGDVTHQDRTTDIYALGILMYQLAVGKLPFTGTNQEVLAAQISKKVPVNDIPNRDLRHIVEKATQKKQEKRYATAAEMIVDLEHISMRMTTASGRTTHNTISTGLENSNKTLEAILWSASAVCGAVFGVIVKLILA